MSTEIIQQIFWYLLFFVYTIPAIAFFLRQWNLTKRIIYFYIGMVFSILFHTAIVIFFHSLYGSEFIQIDSIFSSFVMFFLSPFYVATLSFLYFSYIKKRPYLVIQRDEKSIYDYPMVPGVWKTNNLRIVDKSDFPEVYNIFPSKLTLFLYTGPSMLLCTMFLFFFCTDNSFHTWIGWVVAGIFSILLLNISFFLFRAIKCFILNIPFLSINSYELIIYGKKKYAWNLIQWEYISIQWNQKSIRFFFKNESKRISLFWLSLFFIKNTLPEILAIYRARSWCIYIPPDIPNSYLSGNILPTVRENRS